MSINQEKVPLNSQNSYLRVDGPRVWVEMVVQAAVASKSNGFVHYHSLWRDKLADYGNEFGGYPDTSSTQAAGSGGTSYTRPSFTTQPASVTGSSATFTVAASTSSGTLSYQWYNAGGGISGATSSSYTTGTAGSYYVVVTNTLNGGTTSTTSSTATLTVNSAPTITTQPTSQTVVLGSAASFSVAATGTGTLGYQWYHGGSAISGATAASYAVATTTAASAGLCDVVVTNPYGSATSATVTLTLQEPFAAYLATYGLTGTVSSTTGSKTTASLRTISVR